MNQPTPGRIVLFVLKTGEIRPAIVIQAIEDSACLHVFLKPVEEKAGESAYRPLVYPDEGKNPGTWHWPPRT